MIQMTTHDGHDYYTATARGVEYTATKDSCGWGVWSRRLALGRRNPGSFKRYDSLEALAAGCKAMRGLDKLLANA